MRDAIWTRLAVVIGSTLWSTAAGATSLTDGGQTARRADVEAGGNEMGGIVLRLRGKPDEVAAFERMLADGMADSPTLRKLVDEITSDVDPDHRFDIVLGRHLRGVFIDSFVHDLVDLEDLERLPSARAADLERNEPTREEHIVHILAERHLAAKLAARFRDRGLAVPHRDALHTAAHEAGLAYQNRHRAERGHAAVTAAISQDLEARPGESFMRYEFADGTTSWIKTRDFGRIWQITPPGR